MEPTGPIRTSPCKLVSQTQLPVLSGTTRPPGPAVTQSAMASETHPLGGALQSVLAERLGRLACVLSPDETMEAAQPSDLPAGKGKLPSAAVPHGSGYNQ